MEVHNIKRSFTRAALSLLALLLTAGAGRPVLAAPIPAPAAPAAAPYDRPAGSFQVPEFSPGLHWFNVSKPLTMKELRGKMVLLDFWTYGCINCIHILPQLKNLQAHFGNELVIIGVHSPKFANERSDAGVREAVLRYKIDHPVVSDSQSSLWHTLGVEAWPTVLLVDPDGYVAAGVAGEGVERLLPRMETIAAAYRAAGKLDKRPLNLVMESSHEAPSELAFPGKIVADGAGKRLFIADSGHNRIIVTSLDGTVQQTIGSGKEGRADGSFATASFNTPQGMALVGSHLYVADTNNHLLRRVDLDSRTVVTVAGTGKQAAGDEAGVDPLHHALSSPWDVHFFKGQVYIAMAGDHRIWRFDPARNQITVYAGSGQEDRTDGTLLTAAFAQPSGLAGDGTFLYVADSESSSIRRIDPIAGKVETLAGGNLFDFGHQDGVGLAARFQHPLGLAYHNGVLYIADTYNHDIRTLTTATTAVKTLAGATAPGVSNGKPGHFYEPAGLAFENGILYVADTDNGLVRRVDPTTGVVSTPPIALTSASGKDETTAGTGTAGGSSGTGGSAAAVETGIAGTVFIGPVMPVSREGDPNHRPFAASLQMLRADGTLAAEAQSGADGRFAITVPPGQYTLQGTAGKNHKFPRDTSQPVTVTEHHVTQVTVEFDSGIR